MSEMVFQPNQIVIRRGARLPAAVRENPMPVIQAFYDAVKVNGIAPDVLTAASDPANPMHDLFTWDDLESADKNRLREVFELARSFVDGKTGEPVFVSTYHTTNNIADAGRIHINVRLLPRTDPPVEAPRLVYKVGRAPEVEAQPQPESIRIPYTLHPAVQELASPAAVATSAPPEVVEDPSIAVFRRWVETHKHKPALLREAARILRDAL